MSNQKGKCERASRSHRFGFYVERRLVRSSWLEVLYRVLAVSLALLFAGICIQLSGLSAANLALRAFNETLGSTKGLEEAVTLATPLIFTGLAVAICMKMHIWNIGAEGQFFIGAWAAAAVGIRAEGHSALILMFSILAGAMAGAAWMIIPALARAYANANEIITTLMLNFVAVLLVNYYSIGPWRDSSLGMATASYRIPYELPNFLVDNIHVGVLFTLIIAVCLLVSIQRTRWGYEVTTIGLNRRAAEFVGIPVKKNILFVMLISGAIAGLGGAVQLLGTTHRLSGSISNNYGYLGIIVAALASASPLGVILSGFLLAVLLNAGTVLQTKGLSFNSVYAVTGVILLFAAIGEVATRYRLRWNIPKSMQEDDGFKESSAEDSG